MWSAEHAVFVAVDQTSLFLGMAAPNKTLTLTLAIQVLDGLVGKPFPALLLVRSGLPAFHSKHRIEQQHTLLSPMGQVAMGRNLKTQIPVNFLVDIHQ